MTDSGSTSTLPRNPAPDRCECLCVGIVVVDHLCQPIPIIPRAGTLLETSAISLSIGGCAANVAADLSRLGCAAGVAGAIGRDRMGRIVRDLLEETGVDCSALVELPGYQTSETLVVNVQGEDRRYIHCVGASAGYDGSLVTEQELRGIRALYVGGFLLGALRPEEVTRMFRLARAQGIRTVLDIVLSRSEQSLEPLRHVLPWTDVFLPNTDEAAVLTGHADPVAQARTFRELGAETVVITCGRDGAVLLSPRLEARAGAFSFPTVDGTGTGDAFDAGFIAAILNGADEREALAWGSAAGGSCATAMGATAGVFSRPQLQEFLRSNSLAIKGL